MMTRWNSDSYSPQTTAIMISPQSRFRGLLFYETNDTNFWERGEEKIIQYEEPKTDNTYHKENNTKQSGIRNRLN